MARDDDNPAKQQAKDAHEFLKKFIGNFDKAKRGGIHDFMETLMAMMIQASIAAVDNYLKGGHLQVSGNEVMEVSLGAFQVVLDKAKRNLEALKDVEMQ